VALAVGIGVFVFAIVERVSSAGAQTTRQPPAPQFSWALLLVILIVSALVGAAPLWLAAARGHPLMTIAVVSISSVLIVGGAEAASGGKAAEYAGALVTGILESILEHKAAFAKV